ncbi:hypothetical protein SAMN05660776_2015 [Salegentibacter holothuriorum]|uniref:Sulfotransferase domain-containing protein n=1 Tax=Salegentibacter holothuriorum TaxID=241145 RepID=A0A1T5CKU5_9FLAO|nr:hypothetical protein [Salegentibacter holothuriorum]SKB60135.1 hypothetical protein SAMN05660776_2015 [Salegentibacter holothuriorum]
MKVKTICSQQLARQILKVKGYSENKNHYVFADPRGGSTWLMEIIQTIKKEPVIWEPLYLKLKNSPFKKLNFGWRQYIPEDAEWEEAKQAFDRLFSGEIYAENTLKFKTLLKLLRSESFLFKICRGHALLPWLTQNYNFHYKPIYLIRHPFAVVSSQLRHGAWEYSFNSFEIPQTPYNQHYLEHEAFLKTIKTKEEALVANWCLSNSIPLKHPENNRSWITINYEELVLKPEDSINRILKSWKCNYDVSSIDFRRNSATTKPDSPALVTERLANWEKYFNSSQLDRMGAVLDYFEVKNYSKSNPMPEKSF